MDREPLLYNLQPTTAQFRTTSLVALLSLTAFLALIPFRNLELPVVPSFIPVFDTALFLSDAITATLLLAQAYVVRSKALVALGTGYFFTSLMIIPHGLTFPWAFSPTGLLGAGLNTTTWLYFFWHSGLPAFIIAYALLKKAPDWSHTDWLSPRKAIVLGLISAALLAGALTLLAILGEPHFFEMMTDPIHGIAYKAFAPEYPLMLLIVVAMVLTWRARSSVLDLWLLLVLWAWFLELVMVTLTPTRFSVGWYTGRMIGLLSGLFVLLMLLAETSRQYARTVLQIAGRRWERENGLMVRDAIAAAIAHELRQPLAAIRMNVQTVQRSLAKPDDGTSAILDEIVTASDRANDIITSTRAIFGKSDAQRSPATMSHLIRDTIAMVSRDLRQQDISVELRLDDTLPPIAVNRLQMQQVFYNLILNAAEAMRQVADRPRILTISSASSGDGIVIRVADTGPGIAAADRERIFETFYTTKHHGTGLGLAICRSVIAAHGGQLRVAADESVGAAFEIRLPYAPETGAPDADIQAG